jgi:DNA-binding MarR family transcriptional regulator
MPDFDPIAEAARNWHAHWGADPVPSMRAVTSIMRVQQILLARLNDELKRFDLTFPRYEALMLLYYSRRGALPLGKMGDRLQVHRTSVTNIIDGLERSGFVRREPHERDRRTTLAAITGAGRETAAAATAVLNERRFGTAPLARAALDASPATPERLRADADGFVPARP